MPLEALAGAAAGAAVAAAVVPVRLRRPPVHLVRANVDGQPVAAVLGEPLLAGALAGLVVAAALRPPAAGFARAALATALVAVVMGAAGRFDDLRGDEAARGFRGHLSARRVTGGVVKIGAGAAAGLLAGVVVAGVDEPLRVLETGLLVALAANLVNLLDRAPGRAAKGWFALALPPLLLAPSSWAPAASGLLGASLACAVPDLRARGMLGDMGANPLGAVAGLGWALALARPGRLVAIALLLLLNVVSERVSFSRVIERFAPLRFVDRLGRK